MNILKIVDLVFIIILAIVGIETFIKIKKSEGKKIEEVRKPLLTRINIIIILTILISILTIINVLKK